MSFTHHGRQHVTSPARPLKTSTGVIQSSSIQHGLPEIAIKTPKVVIAAQDPFYNYGRVFRKVKGELANLNRAHIHLNV